MKLIRFFSAVSLVLALASCGAGAPKEPLRSSSCVLDAGDYAMRVRRGVGEVEFIAPEGVRGTVVRFGADGSCVLDTTRSLGRGTSADTAANGTAQTDVDAAQTDGDATQTDGDAAPTGEGASVGGDGAQQNAGVAGEYPGVAIPLSDGRGFHDWLVLAYPEDLAVGAAIADDGTMTFELDGASYSISPDGTCSVTRDGLTRRAVRTDE